MTTSPTIIQTQEGAPEEYLGWSVGGTAEAGGDFVADYLHGLHGNWPRLSDPGDLYSFTVGEGVTRRKLDKENRSLTGAAREAFKAAEKGSITAMVSNEDVNRILSSTRYAMGDAERSLGRYEANQTSTTHQEKFKAAWDNATNSTQQLAAQMNQYLADQDSHITKLEQAYDKQKLLYDELDVKRLDAFTDAQSAEASRTRLQEELDRYKNSLDTATTSSQKTHYRRQIAQTKSEIRSHKRENRRIMERRDLLEAQTEAAKTELKSREERLKAAQQARKAVVEKFAKIHNEIEGNNGKNIEFHQKEKALKAAERKYKTAYDDRRLERVQHYLQKRKIRDAKRLAADAERELDAKKAILENKKFSHELALHDVQKADPANRASLLSPLNDADGDVKTAQAELNQAKQNLDARKAELITAETKEAEAKAKLDEAEAKKAEAETAKTAAQRAVDDTPQSQRQALNARANAVSSGVTIDLADTGHAKPQKSWLSIKAAQISDMMPTGLLRGSKLLLRGLPLVGFGVSAVELSQAQIRMSRLRSADLLGWSDTAAMTGAYGAHILQSGLDPTLFGGEILTKQAFNATENTDKIDLAMKLYLQPDFIVDVVADLGNQFLNLGLESIPSREDIEELEDRYTGQGLRDRYDKIARKYGLPESITVKNGGEGTAVLSLGEALYNEPERVAALLRAQLKNTQGFDSDEFEEAMLVFAEVNGVVAKSDEIRAAYVAHLGSQLTPHVPSWGLAA